MNVSLRIFLAVSALVVLYFVVRKIKKSRFEAADALFWLFFIFALVVLALFPQISYGLSDVLGFEAPSNFVFLCVIGILIMRVFSLTAKTSLMRMKLDALIQEIALLRAQSETEPDSERF